MIDPSPRVETYRGRPIGARLHRFGGRGRPLRNTPDFSLAAGDQARSPVRCPAGRRESTAFRNCPAPVLSTACGMLADAISWTSSATRLIDAWPGRRGPVSAVLLRRGSNSNASGCLYEIINANSGRRERHGGRCGVTSRAPRPHRNRRPKSERPSTSRRSRSN